MFERHIAPRAPNFGEDDVVSFGEILKKQHRNPKLSLQPW